MHVRTGKTFWNFFRKYQIFFSFLWVVINKSWTNTTSCMQRVKYICLCYIYTQLLITNYAIDFFN